jgi:hypothetical protein
MDKNACYRFVAGFLRQLFWDYERGSDMDRVAVSNYIYKKNHPMTAICIGVLGITEEHFQKMCVKKLKEIRENYKKY